MSFIVNEEKNSCPEEDRERLGLYEAMLGAVNEMATKLISHEKESFEEVLSYSLKPIADAAGLKRIAVYRGTEAGFDLKPRVYK